MRTTILVLLTVFAAGCDRDNGGGVAGASRDSKKNIEEVENFQGFISPQISEMVIQNRCGPETWSGYTQHFEDILRSFKVHLDNLERVPVELSEFGLTASFENHEFLVKKHGEVLIRERLPSVFGMHPMRLGIDTLGDDPVIMVANKSRASTGRYFVALYALDGTPLYRNVLIARQVWDIEREAGRIDILGCGETRRLTNKASKPSHSPDAQTSGAPLGNTLVG